MYLKLKSELMPYTYSFAREAVDGMPLIRAMFLDYPNEYTYGTATRYQYMYGTDFLVAPVYQNTKADKEGNDIRNGRIQHFASFNGFFQFFIHVFWQVIPHHGIIEYIHAKNFWN